MKKPSYSDKFLNKLRTRNMEKKIVIVMSADGACNVGVENIPTMPELIGILETVKSMKVNEALGIKPYVSPIIKS